MAVINVGIVIQQPRMKASVGNNRKSRFKIIRLFGSPAAQVNSISAPWNSAGNSNRYNKNLVNPELLTIIPPICIEY
jgi:hypothetical protein